MQDGKLIVRIEFVHCRSSSIRTIPEAAKRLSGIQERRKVERTYYVYILTNKRKGTLYVGVTSDLARRVYEHRIGAVPGFTARYGLKRLVYFEACGFGVAATEHEKRVKRWRRAWKLRLIEERNPQWRDLWDDITG